MAPKKRKASPVGGPSRKAKVTESQAMEPQVTDTQAAETNAKETQAMGTKATKTQTSTTETAGNSTTARKVQKRKATNTSTAISRRATRSMTTDAARQAVLQTDELLDAILVNLSMQQLFVIQRVSKRFKAVIAATPAIQEKMFLRPSNGPVETLTIDELAYGMPVALAKNIVGVHAVTRRPVTLNPMLRKVHDWAIRDRLWLSASSFVLECRPFLIKQSISLLDTFISSPPCREAKLSLEMMMRSARHKRVSIRKNKITMTVVESETGLTFRDIMDAVMDECDNVSISSRIDLRWPERYLLNHTVREAIDRNEGEFGPAFIVGGIIIPREDIIAPSAADWNAVRDGELGDQIVTDKPTSRPGSSSIPEN